MFLSFAFQPNVVALFNYNTEGRWQVISGSVNVRYRRAPARLRKSEASATGVPVSMDSFRLVSTRVEQGLQSVIPAWARITNMYSR